ncbi:hypothetical protein BofuT4_P069980.1 [Botrytis cinerea T4]|uniref:Uncharacterized protein n=1 Tax=Botryotinia fuckeliana (strain T4) TaxID=999810 RepID=G2XQQ3_BOTF4|nr:hypothetical protein BofuT4_P069980.1 [Botrytis cinerea T4]
MSECVSAYPSLPSARARTKSQSQSQSHNHTITHPDCNFIISKSVGLL